VTSAVVPDAYRDDLAYIHDAGFGAIARAAGPVLLEALARRQVPRELVVDLGCGSGILSLAISSAGYDVLGIDISQAMISLARERVPRGRFRVESLLTAQIPRCVAVAAVGECLNYLFDESNNLKVLAQLFRRVYQALTPDGLLLLDVAGPGRVPGPGPRRVFAEGDDWAVLSVNEEDRRHEFLTRRITSFRRVGDLYRRDQETHRQRLFKQKVIVLELRKTGFRVRILAGYGPLRFGPGQYALLARKPQPGRRS
jgi:SAM-dependent methyltransferase